MLRGNRCCFSLKLCRRTEELLVFGRVRFVVKAVEDAFGNRPEIFFACHPSDSEFPKIYRSREASHRFRTISYQKIFMKIRHCKFPHCLVYRIAKSEHRMIGLADRSPIPVSFIERYHVIHIRTVDFEVEDKRRFALKKKRCACQHGAFDAVSGICAKHSSRRHTGLSIFFKIERNGIKVSLDFCRRIERLQERLFFFRKVIHLFASMDMSISHIKIPERGCLYDGPFYFPILKVNR